MKPLLNNSFFYFATMPDIIRYAQMKHVSFSVAIVWCSLDTLPNDILLLVLAFFNVLGLMRIQFLSKRFYRLCSILVSFSDTFHYISVAG